MSRKGLNSGTGSGTNLCARSCMRCRAAPSDHAAGNARKLKKGEPSQECFHNSGFGWHGDPHGSYDVACGLRSFLNFMTLGTHKEL